MQTVIVSFKNCSNKEQTEIFDVYSRNELDRKVRMTLITDNPGRIVSITAEEWADGDMAVVEKQAAKQAGLDGQAVLVVRK